MRHYRIKTRMYIPSVTNLKLWDTGKTCNVSYYTVTYVYYHFYFRNEDLNE